MCCGCWNFIFGRKINNLPLCNPACYIAYGMFLAIGIIPILIAFHLQNEPEAIQILDKQFGLGVGPGLVDQENFRDFQLRKEFQEAYLGYSRLAEKWSKDDIETKGFGSCKDGCEDNYKCVYGICTCDDKLKIARYGKCTTKEQKLSVHDQEHSWEAKNNPTQAPPPKLPKHCYIDIDRDILDDLVQHKPECQKEQLPATEAPTAPVLLDPTILTCGDCKDVDTNLVCVDKKCQCRQNMVWNARLKQCDLYHDVDCQSAWRVDSDKYKDEADLILGRTPKPPPPLLDVDKLRNVYCSILDGKWEQYLDQIRGGSKPGLFEGPRAFLLLGSIFGFLLFFGVCHRWFYIYTRSFDPRWVMRNSTTMKTQLTTLTMQSGREAMNVAEERRDEARATMMQQQSAM